MVQSANEISIKLSKTKIAILTLGAFAFIAACFWLWTISESQQKEEPTFVKVISVVGLVFFGTCGIYGLTKIFDRKPGLIINQFGLNDNSSAISGHLIKWADIKEFSTIQVKSTRFLLIFVHYPQDYIENANSFKRFWMRLNYKFYGTPLCISSNMLKCDFDELVETIESEMKNYSA